MITNNYKEYKIIFHLYIGQEVYYLYKDYPKRGYIEEIDISIKEMNQYENTIMPIIKYKIKNNWYTENELWTNRKDFQKWIDDNLCYTKYIEHQENTADYENQSVRLISIIERTNNKHPWKKMKLAEIFYTDENNKGYFSYVPFDNITNIRHENYYIGDTKYELMKHYGANYIEDGYYNFVNYDGIKF